MDISTSIVIRTYNEERYLPSLLAALIEQSHRPLEVLMVDSGSTDKSMEISRSFGCKVIQIEKRDFSFGRSLNLGCEQAQGDCLVFISGHCIPTSTDWLHLLVQPLHDQLASYSYGRQTGRDSTKFSEQRIFEKYYPNYSKLPQNGYFCNNANAAILRQVWNQYRFDEDLTGLEDMHLASRLVDEGHHIAYVADASVYHIHDESWSQVKNRYEREAIALQSIAPQLHFTLLDFFRYFAMGVFEDLKVAGADDSLLAELRSIVAFRCMQYWGTYRGHREHVILSQSMKYAYFYPKDLERRTYEK